MTCNAPDTFYQYPGPVFGGRCGVSWHRNWIADLCVDW